MTHWPGKSLQGCGQGSAPHLRCLRWGRGVVGPVGSQLSWCGAGQGLGVPCCAGDVHAKQRNSLTRGCRRQ